MHPPSVLPWGKLLKSLQSCKRTTWRA
jgi:hypothetical protein